MKIKILESAKKDLREGFDFYESDSSSQLADVLDALRHGLGEDLVKWFGLK